MRKRSSGFFFKNGNHCIRMNVKVISNNSANKTLTQIDQHEESTLGEKGSYP